MVEAALLIGVLIVVLLFVVGLGRMAHAREEIDGVADAAARAASLQRNTSLSAQAARTAAQQALGATGVSCTDLQVEVNLSSYQPGGEVTATVSCRTELQDLTLAGFPGSHTFTATSVVPIEVYRSG